ncbi:MAG: hypothetical protein K0B02_02620 [DPANN group archaeon]|nr:hypothetical protein [DPANN group archaeon]
MIKEIKINNNNKSLMGTPKEMRLILQKIGYDNVIVYGYAGTLIADSIDDETNEKMKDFNRKKLLSNVTYHETPIGTIYNTEGSLNKHAIADDLKIAVLDKEIESQELVATIKTVADQVSKYIGDELLTGTGTLSAISAYFSSTLTDEDINKYPEYFNEKNGQITLSEEGNNMLNILKDSWDYLPRNLRSACKMNIKPYLLEVFKDVSENIPVQLDKFQDYIQKELTSETIKKKIDQDSKLLRKLIDDGYYCDYFINTDYDELIKIIEMDQNNLINNETFKKIKKSIPVRHLDSQKYQRHQKDKKYYELEQEHKLYNEWGKKIKDTIMSIETNQKIIEGHGIDPLKQLKMLEDTGYIFLREDDKKINIYKGQNFNLLNEDNTSFCPIGLSDKWDSWKIERQGNITILTKYFKNVNDKLIRISVNSLGKYSVEGNDLTVFDENVKKELNLVEEVINYNLPKNKRKTLDWTEYNESQPKTNTIKPVKQIKKQLF